MIKIPYGVSHFPDMPLQGYHYVDRTRYLEQIEGMAERFLLFLRPRRFGKSLFISTLSYYYDIAEKDQFQTLFGQYYIGQHPTARANSYFILKIDCSGIDTSSREHTFSGFTTKIKDAALKFLSKYSAWFSEKNKQEITNLDAPQTILLAIFRMVSTQAKGKKVYVLIDEYDHFANELLAFDFGNFREIVGQNGFVRKSYEVIKTATGDGIVDRIFITGVSPITLDSLTSGFNISRNITSDVRFNEMMGFTKTEVETMLKGVNIPEEEIPELLTRLTQWYDGYLFEEDGKNRLYNSDMVLYFITEYTAKLKYPKILLPENIASDYHKIRGMIGLNNKRKHNLDSLQQIVRNGQISAKLTRKYSFERPWTEGDFVSLLYYMGMLTIEGTNLDELIFKIPNFAIEQLYFQYFQETILDEAKLDAAEIKISQQVMALAQHNNFKPLLQLAEKILLNLAVEDRAHYNELSIKALFTSFFHQVGYYNIFSELEVQKSKTQKGRIDLLLTRRPPFEPVYQFVFELKYLKKSEEHRLATVKKEAVKQLKQYLKHDDTLKNLDHLQAYVVIFVVNKGKVIPVKV